MQATGFSPDLTRKTTLTVFFHTIFPSEAAGRRACWQVFCLAGLGERRLFHVYHRMGIDNAGILCYIGSTEVNRWVPSGQLEPISMKQRVGFFFYFPDAVRRFYDK